MLPAIESSCFLYYEVRPAFIKGSVQRYLIGVTTDGFIQCPNRKACRNLKMGVSHDRKAVKIKYILICDEALHFPEYKVKMSEVPELLCDMVAHNCKKLWLLYYTICSITLLLVTFNDKLWNTLLKVAKEKYDTSNPKMPT